jgi:hypothetical protein
MLPDIDITQELESLIARVTVLEDVEALRRLHHRFHELINDNRWESVGELFAPDAELDYAHLGSYRGREVIGEFFERLPAVIEADEWPPRRSPSSTRTLTMSGWTVIERADTATSRPRPSSPRLATSSSASPLTATGGAMTAGCTPR